MFYFIEKYTKGSKMKKGFLKSLLVLTIANSTLYGALTQTEVSELYVSIFNRASEGEGNRYWQTNQIDMVATANVMLNTEDAKKYFGSSLNSNQAFIEHIYKNTLNKTISDDADGISYWTSQLDTKSRGQVIVDLIGAAKVPENAGDAQEQFLNRVEVSNYMAVSVEKAPSDYATSTSFSSGLIVTVANESVDNAHMSINTLSNDAPSRNKAPIVNAGADITVKVNQPITLTGTATDSDGIIVSYEWKKGSEVLATTLSFSYTPTEVGTDVLTLVVVDDDGDSGSDSVSITVEEEASTPTPTSDFGGKK